jgi:putative redox protein
MTAIDLTTDRAGEYPQTIRVRTHVFAADASVASGGTDSAPGPHDYFDSALAACKAITAMWVAKKNSIPLERVAVHVESDNTKERDGVYKLGVRVELIGAQMSPEQHARIHRAIAQCPIHKLMTTTDVQIETVAS